MCAQAEVIILRISLIQVEFRALIISAVYFAFSSILKSRLCCTDDLCREIRAVASVH